MEYHIHTLPQLAAAVKSRRKTRGLTQQEVASRVGLLAKTVSALENSPGTSTIESLFKLLSALDLEIAIATKETASPAEPQGEW